MLHAFVYSEVAAVVRHWFEVDLGDSHLEHGARIELRLLDPQPHRGSESAAQRIVLDDPVWRADLFDRVDGEPGAFEAAHFHPHFEGVEPSRRHWAAAVKAAPWRWLEDQLSDIAAVSTAAGVRLREPTAEAELIRADAPAILVRADAPAIVAAAQSRAADQCVSKEQCHAWTRDVTGAVRLMLAELARPDLLDAERVSPWTTQPART